LIGLIVKLSGKDLKLEFDVSKPSGAPRRCPDISKPARLIGYEPKVRIEEGLRETLNWYQQQKGGSQ